MKKDIPKDKVSDSHGFRNSDCYAVFYGKNKKEVEKKANEYFAAYPTEGYSTSFEIPTQQHSKGYWYCKIKRWSSCE